MPKLLKILPAACWLALLAAPAAALFEDDPAGARQLGFGGQAAALEDPLAMFANPALSGAARKFETGASVLASHRNTQGPADFAAYGAWALVPRLAYGRMGTLALGGLYHDDDGVLTQKTILVGWGTSNLLRRDHGIFDFGANFKIMHAALSAGDEAVMGVGLDLGAAFRPDSSHTLGLSILNLNNPSYKLGTLKDSAPRVLRLGVSERREDYTLSLDMAVRSGSSGRSGTLSLNPGVEHLWRTERSGRIYARSGLRVAERSSALSAGLGWKHAASELSYGIAVPLTGTVVPAHSVALSLRFGDRDLEGEYGRMIKQEIKYRKDLVEALDESARREALLKEELASLKAEIDSLSARLRGEQQQKAAVSNEKERLAAVVRRQEAAEAELRAMSEKRRRDKLNQLKYDFSSDWQAYLKLKAGGAPPDVLKAALQRTVAQYQDAGIDISPATMELQSLLAGK